MKKKIFITGISSAILLYLIDRINLKEYKIYGLTRNPQNVKTNPHITLVKGDIKDLHTIKFYLQKCSIVIHGAAVTHSFNENKYFEINLEATKKLVRMANQCGIKKFIFISSNTASEKSGAYGKTKFLAEKFIENNFKHWLMVRPAEIYGGNKNEGIDKFISGIINNPLAFYPAGVPSKLNPVHLADVAETIYNVIFEEEITNQKITIAGPAAYSFPELIGLIQCYKQHRIISIPISKYVLFFVEKVTRLIPFNIGIIPDQIPRLYSRKNSETTQYRRGKRSLEIYLKEKIVSEPKI